MAAASEQSEVAAASGAQRLRGRVALITGAGGAIGAAIAKLFAKHGAKVAVADLSEEVQCARAAQSLAALALRRVGWRAQGGAQTVREIAAAGGVASFTRVNVAEEKEVSAWIDAVARQWGTVDVLVNNAAAFVFGTVEEATSEMWDQVGLLRARCGRVQAPQCAA
jgi:NAD(P)-dependent dehydrogenase (short-subunit alcohol dehydrogenase family)